MYRFAAAIVVACLSAAAVEAQGSAATAIQRYRAAIAALLQIKPGMVAAEVAATSGVLAPDLSVLVGGTGRVVEGTLDRQSGALGLEPASADAVALLGIFALTDRHKDVVDRAAAALRSGGALLVVDVPQENDGKKTVGIEADDVVKLATAAGLKREAESGIVPGHYSIRFRKP